MKIWPFDRYGWTLAEPTNPRGKVLIFGQETAAGVLGHTLSTEEFKQGLAVVEEYSPGGGDKMGIAIEGHARWDLPTFRAHRAGPGATGYHVAGRDYASR